MPQLIDTIDDIARKLGRNVLMVGFGNRPAHMSLLHGPDACDWETDAVRTEVLKGLEARGIHHDPCMPISSPGFILYPYQGHVYVDVPDDPQHPAYKALVAYLEFDDGSPRFPGVQSYIVPPTLPHSEGDDANG